MFNSIHEITKCITSLLGFTHALNDDVLSMFYHPFSRWPRTAPALHPGCREANYLPSGGGREALCFFFMVAVFISGDMIYNSIDHLYTFVISPYSTHKSKTTL